jgi:CubicO group peptidase (beta-lactamase class C family)
MNRARAYFLLSFSGIFQNPRSLEPVGHHLLFSELKMKKIVPLLLCLSLLPLGAMAQKELVKNRLGEKLDNLMAGLSAEGYSGAVLVVDNGEIILRKGYGLADRARKIQNTPATLFNVASIGKIFTAAAIFVT